jgi:hypothetical protein
MLALRTSAHGVAHLTRTDLRSGKENEETFLITDAELLFELMAAPASAAREDARLAER